MLLPNYCHFFNVVLVLWPSCCSFFSSFSFLINWAGHVGFVHAVHEFSCALNVNPGHCPCTYFRIHFNRSNWSCPRPSANTPIQEFYVMCWLFEIVVYCFSTVCFERVCDFPQDFSSFIFNFSFYPFWPLLCYC